MTRRSPGPLARFLSVEAVSSLFLLLAATFALAWANSSFASAYVALWHYRPLGSPVDLHFLVNDGVMTLFFLVVGLEIRRELHGGELAEWRRAALPLFAAAGGMIVPALIYSALNPSPPAAHGWGVPMATDIAFAVGVLSLLGRRVPAGLRVLLLALAVIDDIGAILVIAVFYSSGIAPAGLVIAAAAVVVVLGMRRLGVRSPWLYVLPGAALWYGLYRASVHPTLAGVVLGLLTPAEGEAGRPAPTVTLEAALHGWIAYLVMPLFALANAGVAIGALDLTAPSAARVLLGVALGLLLGKPLGIWLACFLAVKAGISALPRGVTYGGVAIVGMVGGIGFTVAIFVANLAFDDPALLAVAKAGVLMGSFAAGVLGLTVGRSLKQPETSVTEITPDDAERSELI